MCKFCDNLEYKEITIPNYNKVRDLIIDQYSARFCINFCPMCGKRIFKELHEDLKFW